MGSFMVLIVIIVVILIVWWALLRNVKNYKPDFDVHGDEEHAETGHGETAFGHLDSAEHTLIAQETPSAPLPLAQKAPMSPPVVQEIQPDTFSGASTFDVTAADDEPITSTGVTGETPDGTLAAGATASVVTGPGAAGTRVSQPDDLTILEGVGPKISEILHQNGIHTFADVAAVDVTRLREILETNELRFIDPATWPQQARLASEGRIDELKAYTDTLRGGRTVS